MQLGSRSLAALLAVAAFGGCGVLDEPPPFQGLSLRPTRGYVFVTLDALRADHLGAYGYERSTSPFFDSLAARGILFERAFAPYPATLVSNISLFTGLYPNRHSVYPPSQVLSDRVATLPEHLAAQGFRTMAHTEGGYMAGGFGFARGFERYTEDPHESESHIERTFSLGESFLRDLGEDERFFLFLHSYTTHDPYHPLPDYGSLYWEGEAPGGVPDPTGANLRSINKGRIEASEAADDYYAALYDASIRYADDVLARFFAELERLGLADDTTVVIASDHGEEFREHGSFGHTQVYPESLRIPLLIVHPELERGLRIPRLISVVDIAPTLVEMAGLPPMEGTDGRSLVPYLAEPVETSGDVYGEAIDELSVRTLIAENGDRLLQLVATEADTGDEEVWVSREVAFETPEPEIRFEIHAFHEPRVLRVTVNGMEVGEFEADTSWETRELRLPPTERVHTITLTTEGCDSPASVGESDDQRCLSFQVRGMPLRMLELYDLAADPLAKRDISEGEPEMVAELIRRLEGYRTVEAFESEATELSAEERERLRALGYLD